MIFFFPISQEFVQIDFQIWLPGVWDQLSFNPECDKYLFWPNPNTKYLILRNSKYRILNTIWYLENPTDIGTAFQIPEYYYLVKLF